MQPASFPQSRRTARYAKACDPARCASRHRQPVLPLPAKKTSEPVEPAGAPPRLPVHAAETSRWPASKRQGV